MHANFDNTKLITDNKNYMKLKVKKTKVTNEQRIKRKKIMIKKI